MELSEAIEAWAREHDDYWYSCDGPCKDYVHWSTTVAIIEEWEKDRAGWVMKTLENELSESSTPLHVFDVDNSLRLHYRRQFPSHVVELVAANPQIVEQWQEGLDRMEREVLPGLNWLGQR